jgi:hypothetical protein
LCFVALGFELPGSICVVGSLCVIGQSVCSEPAHAELELCGTFNMQGIIFLKKCHVLAKDI